MPPVRRRAKASPARKQPTFYPLLSPADVLGAIVDLSRGLTADIGEPELHQLLFRTLRLLLPNRSIAVRSIDPHTLKTISIDADEGLIASAKEMPPTLQRDAFEYPNMRQNIPKTLHARHGTRSIELVDEHPFIFRGASAGFSVPLIAGGEMTGDVHVNYRGVPPGRAGKARGTIPLRQDKRLVIPVANHVSVVAHTRRLLRETAYLQDYLEQIIDQATSLIVATDLDGKVTIWNRAMKKLTGLARSEVVGKELLALLTQLGAADVALTIKQVAASGEPATREVRLPSVGGAVLRAAFNVATVRGRGGERAAILAIGQDVTALRSLQSQVIHAEKLSTVGQIAAGVAHEINNPLTSIQVCADTLAHKAELAAQGRPGIKFEVSDLDKLRKIQEGAQRIARFARDLVSYARPSGTEIEEVSLNEVVEYGLSFCEHVLAEAGAEVERDFARALPHIHAVRDQILQVVINLVTNAAHAVAKGEGKIRIRTWSPGDAIVHLAVSDNGTGIRDEDRAQIFEPFFSTKPAGKGTGLGLSVVRNIVYSHGGQISFQGRQGGGTTFLVMLPVNNLAVPLNS